MEPIGKSIIKPFEHPNVGTAYVAFLDVLGFSQRIENGFDEALGAYRELLRNVEMFEPSSSISLRVYSDAILVSSPELVPVIKAVHTLNMLTLFGSCLVRGGIGYGLHAEEESGANTFVVSQALSRAVEVEKRIRRPCVGLHASVDMPDIFWLNDADNYLRPLLFFDGIVLVNPFNIGWGVSARHRVAMMRDEYPEHSEKYDWFLRLYDAVSSGENLVPLIIAPNNGMHPTANQPVSYRELGWFRG